MAKKESILKWCHDYAERMEADRCMTKEEIKESIEALCYAIENHTDEYLIEGCRDNLYEEDSEDAELLRRLEKLLK